MTASTDKRRALAVARDALGVAETALEGADLMGLSAAQDTVEAARRQLFRAWGLRCPRLGSQAALLLSRLEEAESALIREVDRRKAECPVRFEHNVGVAADGRWFFYRGGKHGMSAGWTPEREAIRYLTDIERHAAMVLGVDPDWYHSDPPPTP